LKKKNHIKKISDYAMVGGLGSLLVVGLVGCGDNSSNNQQQNQNNSTFTNASQQQGAFVVVNKAQMVNIKLQMNFQHQKQQLY